MGVLAGKTSSYTLGLAQLRIQLLEEVVVVSENNFSSSRAVAGIPVRRHIRFLVLDTPRTLVREHIRALQLAQRLALLEVPGTSCNTR